MPFQFRLASVAKVQVGTRNEKRISLKETLLQEAEIAAAITSLQQRLETLRQQKKKLLQKRVLPIQTLQQFHQSEQKLMEKIHWQQEQLEEIRQFAEKKRKALVSADQNVKTLEKLEEKQRALYQKKIRRKAA